MEAPGNGLLLKLDQVCCLLECCRHKLVDIASRKQIIVTKELVKSNVLTLLFFLEDELRCPKYFAPRMGQTGRILGSRGYLKWGISQLKMQF